MGTASCVLVNAIGAGAGGANFAEAPRRDEYPPGADGDEEHAAFIDGTFHDEGAEVTLDKRDLHVGLFGDWLERSGYGKYIERVQNEEKGMLWELRAVRAVRARNFSNHTRVRKFKFSVSLLCIGQEREVLGADGESTERYR